MQREASDTSYSADPACAGAWRDRGRALAEAPKVTRLYSKCSLSDFPLGPRHPFCLSNFANAECGAILLVSNPTGISNVSGVQLWILCARRRDEPLSLRLS